LKVVVKNTGHDYLGRSTARGGFLIWTHFMKEILYNSTFTPEGAPATTENTFNGDSSLSLSFWNLQWADYYIHLSAVTLGAGVQWHEAYDSIHQQGRFIVGGYSLGASVGAAGGWVMGGGHSAFSPKFGLGKIVTFILPLLLIHDTTIQVLITFFNLLLFLPMDLSSPLTPSNTQICFGHYAVVAEVLTVS